MLDPFSDDQLVTEQAVVDECLDEIDAYVATAFDNGWVQKSSKAGKFIDGLYDEFAPNLCPYDRLVGKNLGAVGLTYVECRYGDSWRHPLLYGGAAEHEVLATYHNATHARDFIKNLFMYAAKVNERLPGTYDRFAYMRFPAIGAFHDAIMGNGRGNDERQSALLGAEMMVEFGLTFEPDEPTYAAILSTTWDPALKRQVRFGDDAYKEYEIAAQVADFLQLFDERGPYCTICLIIEDMCKEASGKLLNKQAKLSSFSLDVASVAECVKFIDSSPKLKREFARILKSQVEFFESFNPADSDLDKMFPGRPCNVWLMKGLSADYSNGRINAYETLRVAREFMQHRKAFLRVANWTNSEFLREPSSIE